MNRGIIIITALFSALALTVLPSSAFGRTEGSEDMIRTMTPPVEVIEKVIPEKDEWYFDSFYEPSVIIQGNRTGRWSELTTTFGYSHKNVQGYFNVQQWDRIGNNDYTANWGAYLNFKDSYARMETGFGWDIDYMHDFQAIAEYGHKLIKTVYWQVGYNYRMYRRSGDSHTMYPGLIYYFGDSYISANYGAGWIESRDAANFGTVRGSFAITSFLKLFAGAAFGERLYDIYGKSARKEPGYILFIGINSKLYKGISWRIGYVYGAEQPKFQKHGMHYALMVKF